MNFEGLEQFRAKITEKVMESMAEIAADPKADVSERIKAAKVVDAMSDSIIKAYMLSEFKGVAEDSSKRISKQIERLNEDKDK